MESQYSSPRQHSSESYAKEVATKKAEELNEAVRYGSIETVQRLLKEGANVNSNVSCGWTPLLSAVQRNKEEMVHFLLDQGANSHAKKKNGATPLIVAGITGNVSLLKLFLDKGSNVNEHDSNGFTAFMEAAWHGKEEALRFLYSNGADVNLGRVTDEEKKALNKGGGTALMDAAREGHVAIVEALVKDMEADVNACDNQERNALVHALSVTKHGVWDREKKETIALFLLKNGADVNKRDENGATTLMLAAERESQRLVDAILERDEVDIDATDRKGKTALRVAVERANLEIAKLLCEKGARRDIVDLCEIADSYYNAELKQLLCKYTSSLNQRQPRTQWTPSSERWGPKLQNLHAMLHPMIGKLKVFQDEDFRIGTSQGHVYLGFYDGKEVAVKIFCLGTENAEREKTCLEKCHASNHLVRFCGCEEQKGCLYLCLSLCEKNLDEYFQMADNKATGNTAMKTKEILKTIFLAVKELHSFGFSHQDLHPSNILIDVTGKIFLADFDKSRKVAADDIGATLISEDLQALGRLTLYVAMRGQIRFKDLPMQCPVEVADFMEVEDIRMNLESPNKNIGVSEQLEKLIYHPYFWNKEMRYRVLRDVGNESDIKTWNTKHRNNNSEILKALNHEENPFNGWISKIDDEVLESMGPSQGKDKKNPEKNKQRYEDSVAGLLKLIRDMGEHFEEKSKEVKDIIVDPADYFLSRFPDLTLYVYQSLCNTQYNKHFSLIAFSISARTVKI